jgi:hypothetical protein
MFLLRRWGRTPQAKQERGGRVGVFEIDGRFLFEVKAWWEEMGARGTSGQIEEVSGTASDMAIGLALLRAFGASLGARVIKDASGAKPLIEKAGVKSNAALLRKARYVATSRSPEALVQLSPSTVEGSGWVGAAPADSLLLEGPSADELGAAVRVAISRCGSRGDQDER